MQNGNTPLRALVVEDEGMTVLLLKRALKNAGFEVVGIVSDGEEAIVAARLLLPDFILMDINMPRMNGIEATRHIYRERPTPIIMLSAYLDEATRQQAADAGACAYLVKPIALDMVAPSVRSALRNFTGAA